MKSNKSKYTDKEKLSPAYWKKLEDEIVQLKKSLASTQDQASILQKENANLVQMNIVYKERARGAGLLWFINAIALLAGGSGITYAVDQKYENAAPLLITAFILLLISQQSENIVTFVFSLFNSRKFK
jgi:DMSO reductase anchor subunit